jgi:hypothetical protein
LITQFTCAGNLQSKSIFWFVNSVRYKLNQKRSLRIFCINPARYSYKINFKIRFLKKFYISPTRVKYKTIVLLLLNKSKSRKMKIPKHSLSVFTGQDKISDSISVYKITKKEAGGLAELCILPAREKYKL